jgi:hypothetical protein
MVVSDLNSVANSSLSSLGSSSGAAVAPPSLGSSHQLLSSAAAAAAAGGNRYNLDPYLSSSRCDDDNADEMTVTRRILMMMR